MAAIITQTSDYMSDQAPYSQPQASLRDTATYNDLVSWGFYSISTHYKISPSMTFPVPNSSRFWTSLSTLMFAQPEE